MDEINISDLKKRLGYRELETIDYNTLYCNMAVPSTINAESVAMEYIQKWFFNKIPRDYFKRININGKHALDDFRNLKINKNLKVIKPWLFIKNDIHLEQNRDMIDLYFGKIDTYLKKSMFNKKFFNDTVDNLYISMCLEQYEIAYNFAIKLSTRAQQLDLYKYMQLAYRVGSTQGEYIDIDAHIPYNLLLNLAKQKGFKIENEKIVNVRQFLKYLNSNSIFNFLYKYRTLTGKDEFYIRIPDMYMHISNLDPIDIDDGDREGMISSNFTINMQVILHMPTPKMYVFYSKHPVPKELPNYDKDIDHIITGLYPIYIPDIPKQNDKGWSSYLTTDYEEEDTVKPLSIELEDLLKTDNRLWDVIEYNKQNLISNEVFLDFKLYNDGKLIDLDTDWKKLIITTKNNVKDIRSRIVLYVDLLYLNETLRTIQDLNNSRMKVSERQKIE